MEQAAAESVAKEQQPVESASTSLFRSRLLELRQQPSLLRAFADGSWRIVRRSETVSSALVPVAMALVALVPVVSARG